jgi:hypothetical protein
MTNLHTSKQKTETAKDYIVCDSCSLDDTDEDVESDDDNTWRLRS